MSIQSHRLSAFHSIARARAVMILLSSAALSSCGELLGDNVKGSFVCSAPGGTCAPSTLIDDQALALIGSARPAASESQGLVGLSQAKPRAEVFWSARSRSASGRSAGPARVSNNLLHSDTRTLRLVFPAYVDDAGNLHEARVVHTVVDRGSWIELTDGSLAPRTETDSRDGVASLATAVPNLAETAIPEKSFGAPLMDRVRRPASPQSGLPSPLTIDAIRAQIAERLSATAKPAQPNPHIQATARHQGATPPSTTASTSETASPPTATPGMPTVANPPASFSTPEVD